MSIGLLYWILMILWLVYGIFTRRVEIAGGSYIGLGGSLLEFILFFLIGWRIFGFIIHE